MNFKSVEEILDFAIEREQEAYDFYMQMADKLEIPGMKQVFKDFAHEEEGHKKKIQGVKSGKVMLTANKKVTDLKIGDYLVEVEPSPNLDYQEALIIAMKKEKAAYRLYNDLAGTTDDTNARELFLGLAQEEAKHKLRFEIEYDNQIMQEN